MKTIARFIALLTIFATAAHGDEADESWEIHGRVVDGQGNPVESFDIGTFWSANGNWWDESGEPMKINGLAVFGKKWKDEGTLVVSPHNSPKLSAGGMFSLKQEGGPYTAVFATEKDHTRGGVVAVSKADRDKPVTIALQPLIRVRGKIYCPECERTPDWTGVRVHLPGDFQNWKGFIFCGSIKGEFSFLLPSGIYDLNVYSESPDAGMARPNDAPLTMPQFVHGFRLKVPDDKSTLDLGVLFVELGKGKNGLQRGDYSRHYGKEPPALEITDACGVDKNVRLSDYRGKWVLLDFWTLSCGPCIVDSLPKLAKLYKDHSAKRDNFEILSICVTDFAKATTKDDYEKLVAPIVESAWHGEKLPFPVLIDGEGKTLNAYGIQGVPKTLLIDPEGNLVKFGDEAMLEEKLKEKRP